MNTDSNKHIYQGKRVLIVTAVEVEREAVLRGLADAAGFEVIVGGVGQASIAAATATELALASVPTSTNPTNVNAGAARNVSSAYKLVVSMGIGGGFVGQAEVGSLVVASQIIAADLGAETQEGFSSIDELGFGSAYVQADGGLAARVTAALAAAQLPVRLGPIVTVNTVTGSAATAARLSERIPDALAEAMEGYGVAIAAKRCGLPVLEIRSISNPVGPRDRSAWRIKEALEALTAASATLEEALQ